MRRQGKYRGIRVEGLIQIGKQRASQQFIPYVAGDSVGEYGLTSMAKARVAIDTALDVVGAKKQNGRLEFPHSDHLHLWCEYMSRPEEAKKILAKGWHEINRFRVENGLAEVDANGNTIRKAGA